MLDRKLARDLWQVKGQVVTIALVVASGIAAFSAALSTYDSLRVMQAAYYESARFAHVFTAARRVPNTVEPRLLEIPGVAEAETTVAFDVLLDVPGVLEPMGARVIALPERGTPRMNRLTLKAGRWIDSPQSNQVLVNEAFAEARKLRPGDRVTALLNGKRESLLVTGIALSPEYIFPVMPGVQDESTFGIFWIGRERLAAAFNMEGAFNRVALRLAHDASEPAVIGALDRLLDPYGSTGAHGRDEQTSHRQLSHEIAQMRGLGILLPSVFLGVAVFLLNVVLTRQIGTQRGQIAALKALGCEDWRIMAHYLKFVLVIAAMGVVLGTVLGAWLGRALTLFYANFFHFPVFDYQLRAWIPLVAGGATLAGGVLGGLHVLLGVAQLPPAEAMRPVAPLTFRPTLAERLGFGHLYSPAVRMIVRDMERRPVRAAFTTLGIAASVAILLSVGWWRDGLDYVLDVEMQMRERQDVSVVLAEATSQRAEYDLAQLPGVVRAEADRTAAVRLHYGHRSHRTTITGLPQDSQMRLLLDERLQPLPVPQAGLVMNARLAERLGVRRGDSVRVEFLQGARTSGDVQVVNLVNEAMGQQTYMDRDALNRLLGEGDAVSGARLRVDAGQREAFLRQVKETPRLAFVMELAPLIRQVRVQNGRTLLVFTGVLSAFAATIAVGVVYNNARIALAERSWELASLRVLGFTRGEVSGLLLGELALEMLIALPLGWLLGYGLSVVMVRGMAAEDFVLPLVLRPAVYAYATIVVLVAGLISGLIVRRRIDRLDLVAVLKTRE